MTSNRFEHDDGDDPGKGDGDGKGDDPGKGVGDDQDRGVYSISVTAELVGTGVQNLRLYERRGLVEPRRTSGGTRLYSANDVRRLSRITKLLGDGLNLVGVAMVLELQDDVQRLRQQVARRRPARGLRPAEGDPRPEN